MFVELTWRRPIRLRCSRSLNGYPIKKLIRGEVPLPSRRHFLFLPLAVSQSFVDLLLLVGHRSPALCYLDIDVANFRIACSRRSSIAFLSTPP
jgi:hypothetical protein